MPFRYYVPSPATAPTPVLPGLPFNQVRPYIEQYAAPSSVIAFDDVLQLGTGIDAAEVLRWVGRMAGDDDPRYDRIAALLMG